MCTLYTCRCFSGCYQNGLKLRLVGHHMEWQKVAHAVELADLEWMGIPGLKIEMGRETSLAHDMQLRYQLPNDAALRSAHVDIASTRKTLEWAREDDVKAIKSASHRSMTLWFPLKLNRCIAGESTVDGYGRRFGCDRMRWPKRTVYEPLHLPKEVTDAWIKSGPPSFRISSNRIPRRRAAFMMMPHIMITECALDSVDFQRLRGFKSF